MGKKSDDLQEKVALVRGFAVYCITNQCTRGQTERVIVGFEEEEGVAEVERLKHVEQHRAHERQMNAVLAKIRMQPATSLPVPKELASQDDSTSANGPSVDA